MADSLPPLVAIFARAPVLGRVKTRLAATIGDDLALAVHRHLLEHTLAVAAAANVDCELWLDAPFEMATQLVQRLQPSGDLGERMLAVVDDAARRGRGAIVLGCDCPVLDADYLRRAVVALATHDVVLGPVEDGGYILIGMQRPQPDLLLHMRWSHAGVTAETLTRARRLALKVAVLETLWDLDDSVGWARWQALAEAGRRPSQGRE